MVLLARTQTFLLVQLKRSSAIFLRMSALAFSRQPIRAPGAPSKPVSRKGVTASEGMSGER